MPKKRDYAYLEAERRIVKAKRSKQSSLDLSRLSLTTTPDSLAHFSNLQILDLGDNQITTIPDSFAQLSKLLSLNLNGNQITTIPDSLAQLSNLEHFGLSGNQITTIPDSLAQLSNLLSLNLSSNQITTIPDSLAQLSNLLSLNLSSNQITTIPDSLAQLSNLKILYLDGNQITIPDSLAQLSNLLKLYLNNNKITATPDSLAQISNLQELNLGNNQIITICDSLAQLSNLKILYLDGNKITAIPDSLAQLSKLQYLSLRGNPLPDELLAAADRGVESLFLYLKSTARAKVYPRTVKLVLLGEPLSGKTTLLEALKGNPHPCDDSRKETLGVNVINLPKTHPTDHQPMYLSVWDFAGQHIEHATHQFFLTENAVYLILWNARQGTASGKHDLWYWLELLKMRVREPKFLLVATHTEHTPPDLNLSDIERSYSGCQGHFPVEFSNLTGFAALQEKILSLAAASSSLGAAWPKPWLKVRDDIRNIRETQPHMSADEFRSFIRKRGIVSEEETELAHQLHDLGEIVYFQESDELSNLVILNPEWVSHLIALVVRSDKVRESGGMLRKSHLNELWANADLEPTVRNHLILLMDGFDLTYQIQHSSDIGIVAEALPFSTPENLEQIRLPSDKPQMEMIFRFPSLQRHLPPGIPTWGIARAHRFSKCKPWRDAARFEDPETGSHALILASDTKKEVRLRVAADYPPFFFGQLESILRDTFRRYPGANPERRLPCPCQPECSYSFKYGPVVLRRKDGETQVSCDESGKNVLIEQLLTGFEPPNTDEARIAFESQLRRKFTAMLRALNEQMEKDCPSVFTLFPSAGFTQLETWFKSATKKSSLDLTLYCEYDKGWHPTSHSVYRFQPDQEWFDKLKKRWNQFTRVTKYVGPLTGKKIELPELPSANRSPYGEIGSALGEKRQSVSVSLELRRLLKDLIEHLDQQRSIAEQKNGGLHRHLVEDGRLLWLCPKHKELYRGRT